MSHSVGVEVYFYQTVTSHSNCVCLTRSASKYTFIRSTLLILTVSVSLIGHRSIFFSDRNSHCDCVRGTSGNRSELAHSLLGWRGDRSHNYTGVWSCHRVDSVIESSLQEIIGSKNFVLIYLSLNFCEKTIYDNKAFLENLVAVH